MYRYNKRSKRRYNKQSGNIRTIRDDEDRRVIRGGRRSSHEVGRIVTKVVQRFLVQVCIDLSNGFGTAESRLDNLFLLSTSLIPCLSLLLIRQGGQSARDLPDFNVPQRTGEFLSVGLDKTSIQRLVLMLLDDEVEDLARENDKILFGLRVGAQDRSDVNLCARGVGTK